MDVQLPFLFYYVPNATQGNLATPFTDRFWDDREHWISPGIGVVANSLKPYFGPLPTAPYGPQEGTDTQWQEGFLYSSWIAGKYGPATCWPLAQNVLVVKVEQIQDVVVAQPVPPVSLNVSIDQIQDLVVNPFVSNASIDQIQDLVVNPFVSNASIDQIQDVVVT